MEIRLRVQYPDVSSEMRMDAEHARQAIMFSAEVLILLIKYVCTRAASKATF